MSVIIETSLGDLEVDLFVKKAPEISKNFIKLCKLKHYNNALFLEVQRNYLTSVQTKKETTFWKEIGESREFLHDEIDVTNKHNRIGYLSTRNAGQDRNTSEFFITLTNQHLQHFDEKHTIFGQVQVGQDVLEKFNTEVIVDAENMPYINHRILHTIVIDDPFEDPENFEEPMLSPTPIEKSDNNRLEFHEKERILNETDKTEEEIIDEAKQQITKMREIKLQMLGDIPDADMKPPENILFVCQLNPITQERDLEIIFSRFGIITKCEVVKDWKTGVSLQYAFIEFETEKSCQEAYFKMNGALIDERRIHVDFSQSLQKFKNNKRPNQHQKKKLGNSFDNIEFSKFYRNNNYNSNKHKMIFDQDEDQYTGGSGKNNQSNNNSSQREQREKLDQLREKERERYRNNRKDQNENDSDGGQNKDKDHQQRKRSPEPRNSESINKEKSQEDKQNGSRKDKKRSNSNEKSGKRSSKSTEKSRKRSKSKSKERKRSHDRRRSKSREKDRQREKKRYNSRSASKDKDKKRKRSLSPSRTFSRTSVSHEKSRKDKDRKHDSKRDRSRSQKKKDKKSK